MKSHAADLEMIPPTNLKPWARNARTHSRKQIRQIAESLSQFGFTNPVLIDDNRRILAGHGRVLAAIELGLDAVPCRSLAGLSETEKRAYVLADNKLALNAGWDEELLAEELGELLATDLDFDIGITGFSIPEIDPLYCDRILARWEAWAKDDALQLVCGWSPEAAERIAA